MSRKNGHTTEAKRYAKRDARRRRTQGSAHQRGGSTEGQTMTSSEIDFVEWELEMAQWVNLRARQRIRVLEHPDRFYPSDLHRLSQAREDAFPSCAWWSEP